MEPGSILHLNDYLCKKFVSEIPCSELLSSEPKLKRQTWDKVAMARAIEAVRAKKMGLRRAVKEFSVPKTTLLRFVNSGLPAELVVHRKAGRKLVLPAYLEEKLIGYIFFMKRQHYGLTHADVQRLAYQLATKYQIKHPFHDNKAGKSWLDLFLKRHKLNLPQRKLTGTSATQANQFNRTAVDNFFDILERAYEGKNFTQDRIFNVGEIAFSVFQSKIPRVIASRGREQIEKIAAADCDSLVTVVCSMSASGIFIPPMMIYPRKTMTKTLMKGAPPGALGRCHPSGWIQTNLFTEWFQHFVDNTKPSAASPILLILDGHNNHTKNIDVIDMARVNHITIISIPPHSTHLMQPLDKTFMRSLKSYYTEEIQKRCQDSERRLNTYDVAELFGKAYHQCQRGDIAAYSFRSTGIHPCNRGVFADTNFIASKNIFHDTGYRPFLTKLDEAVPDTRQYSAFLQPEQSDRSGKFSSATMGAGSPRRCVLEKSMNHIAKGKGRDHDYEDSDMNCPSSRPGSSRIVDNCDADSVESEAHISNLDSSSNRTAVPYAQKATCISCNQKFPDDNEGEVSILCESCGLWAHHNCVGCETEYYICDFCK